MFNVPSLISIFLLGWETWILALAFIDKLDIFTRTCYVLCLVLNSHQTTWQIRTYVKLLTKWYSARRSVISSLISQVTVSKCRQINRSITFLYLNERLNSLMEIWKKSFKFCPISNLAGKRSMLMKWEC